MSSALWFKRDVDLTRDEAIEAIGIEHGPGGVLAYEEIVALAKKARAGGRVTIPWQLLARRSFVTVPKIRRIVAALAIADLIDLGDGDPSECVVAAIRSWRRWNPSDATAADRMRAYRDRRNSDASPTVTGASR